jgi:two-component system response regulator (stage 0 sporulation protein F)
MNELLKILYVDDEMINLMLFRQLFKSKYSVQTAESGEEGLVLLEKDPDIKIVISDMNMPGMKGMEFIGKAKQSYPETLFYILTGFEITEEIKSGVKAGLLKRYLQKPYKMSEIDAIIQNDLS